MICFQCRVREAHPEALGLCVECDDEPGDAFAFCSDIVGTASSDRTTRDLLELPWRNDGDRR